MSFFLRSFLSSFHLPSKGRRGLPFVALERFAEPARAGVSHRKRNVGDRQGLVIK